MAPLTLRLSTVPADARVSQISRRTGAASGDLSPNSAYLLSHVTAGSDNVAIANDGRAVDSGTIRIGANDTHTATFIAGIRGTTLGDAGQPVLISAKGRLGTAPAGSPTTTSLAATVERLSAQLTRQQRQIDRLRDRVKGG